MDRFERLSTNLVSSFMEEWFSFCIISQNDTCSYSGKRIMPIILSWAVMLLLYLASHLVVNASFCSVIQREKSQLETEFQTNSLRFWTGMLSTMFSTIIQYQAIFFFFSTEDFNWVRGVSWIIWQATLECCWVIYVLDEHQPLKCSVFLFAYLFYCHLFPCCVLYHYSVHTILQPL